MSRAWTASSAPYLLGGLEEPLKKLPRYARLSLVILVHFSMLPYLLLSCCLHLAWCSSRSPPPRLLARDYSGPASPFLGHALHPRSFGGLPKGFLGESHGAAPGRQERGGGEGEQHSDSHQRTASDHGSSDRESLSRSSSASSGVIRTQAGENPDHAQEARRIMGLVRAGKDVGLRHKGSGTTVRLRDIFDPTDLAAKWKQHEQEGSQKSHRQHEEEGTSQAHRQHAEEGTSKGHRQHEEEGTSKGHRQHEEEGTSKGHPQHGPREQQQPRGEISHAAIANLIAQKWNPEEEAKASGKKEKAESPVKFAEPRTLAEGHALTKSQIDRHLDELATLRQQTEDRRPAILKGDGRPPMAKGHAPPPQAEWAPEHPRAERERLEHLLLGPADAPRAHVDPGGTHQFLKLRAQMYNDKLGREAQLRDNLRMQRGVNRHPADQRRRYKIDLHKQEKAIRHDMTVGNRIMADAEKTEWNRRGFAEKLHQENMATLHSIADHQEAIKQLNKEDQRKQRKKEAKLRKKKEKKGKETERGAGATPSGTGGASGDKAEGSRGDEESGKLSHRPSQEAESGKLPHRPSQEAESPTHRMGQLKISDPSPREASPRAGEKGSPREAATGKAREDKQSPREAARSKSPGEKGSPREPAGRASPKGPQDKQTQTDLPREMDSQHTQTEPPKRRVPREFDNQHTHTEPEEGGARAPAQETQGKKQRK